MDSAYKVAQRLVSTPAGGNLFEDSRQYLISYYVVTGNLGKAEEVYAHLLNDDVVSESIQTLLTDIRSKSIADSLVTAFLRSHDIDPDHSVGP